MLKIGKQLRELRKSRGMTQEYVSRGIGVAKETISKIETDATEPSAETWAKLADFFGVTTDSLREPRDTSTNGAAKPTELELSFIAVAERARGNPLALAEMRRRLDELTKSDVAAVASKKRPARKRGT